MARIKKGPQWAALKAADKHPLVRNADRMLFANNDEFLNIRVGPHCLPDLLSALLGADAITLTWRIFGNAGVAACQDQPITHQFTKAALATLAWPWRAQLFKTLFKLPHFRKHGVHWPKSPVPQTDTEMKVHWFDGSGCPLAPGQRLLSNYSQDNYRLVQLNYYALGSAESYLEKCDRGQANRDA